MRRQDDGRPRIRPLPEDGEIDVEKPADTTERVFDLAVDLGGRELAEPGRQVRESCLEAEAILEIGGQIGTLGVRRGDAPDPSSLAQEGHRKPQRRRKPAPGPPTLAWVCVRGVSSPVDSPYAPLVVLRVSTEYVGS